MLYLLYNPGFETKHKYSIYKKISLDNRDEASPWVCEAVKGVELSGPASSSLLDNLAKKVIFNFFMIFFN